MLKNSFEIYSDMENEILDQGEKEIQYPELRIIPLLLEIIPISLGIIGIIWNLEDLKTLGFFTVILIYIVLSWYLFKGVKFSIWDIIPSILFGFGISIILLGMLFYFQKWEGYNEVIMASHLTLKVLFPTSIIYMIAKVMFTSKKFFEFSTSQHIFLRYLILMIVFYGFGMDSILNELLENG